MKRKLKYVLCCAFYFILFHLHFCVHFYFLGPSILGLRGCFDTTRGQVYGNIFLDDTPLKARGVSSQQPTSPRLRWQSCHHTLAMKDIGAPLELGRPLHEPRGEKGMFRAVLYILFYFIAFSFLFYFSFLEGILSRHIYTGSWDASAGPRDVYSGRAVPYLFIAKQDVYSYCFALNSIVNDNFPQLLDRPGTAMGR